MRTSLSTQFTANTPLSPITTLWFWHFRGIVSWSEPTFLFCQLKGTSGKHISSRHEKLHLHLTCVASEMNQISHSATCGEVCICFSSYCFRSKNKFCRTVGFRLKTPEDLGLLGCCTKWQGDPLQTFWLNVVFSPSRNCVLFYDILTLQDGGSTFLQNVGNGYPCFSAQGLRHLNPKHKASTSLNGIRSLLWELQNLEYRSKFTIFVTRLQWRFTLWWKFWKSYMLLPVDIINSTVHTIILL
jgi:hypothetical protein